MNKARSCMFLLGGLFLLPTVSFAFSWTQVQGPAAPKNQQIRGLASVAGNNVWAVGNAVNGNVLIEHWDGAAWTVVSSPVKPGGLFSVAALSADDIWSVGYTLSGPDTLPLVEHWDGTRWMQIPSPSAGVTSTLTGVSIVSDNDIWAVGSTNADFGSADTLLLMHWDGTAWALVDGPAADSSILHGVKAFASDDVWAVGLKDNDPYTASASNFIIHWNGEAWSEIPSPNVDAANSLFAIDGASPGDIWAVGYSESGPSSYQTTALHWDGSVWTVVPTPANNGTFLGIKAIYSTKVIAVGHASGPLTEAWNGKRWQVIPTPGPAAVDLFAVSHHRKVTWAAGRQTTIFPDTDSFFLMSTRGQ